MWCSHCQLDVPGIASARDDQQICCARCQRPLEVAQKLAPSPATIEEWDLEADIREVEGLVGPLPALATGKNSGSLDGSTRSAGKIRRVDRVKESPTERRQASRTPLPKSRPALIAWMLVAAGLMTFAFGAGLLVYSFLGVRPELWHFGMPVTVGGLGLLVLGLLLQLDGLWQTNHRLITAVEELQSNVEELESSTDLLARQGTSQTFYDHLAAGAAPHMLLADLKGQLDLLSDQLSRE